MNEHLSNRQIAFIVFNTIVGYGVIILPKRAAENAGTGAWLSLILATLGASIVSFLLVKLASLHQNKTIYDYSRLLFGKYLGQAVIAIYIFYFFIMFTMVARNACEAIKTNLLIHTPSWAIIALFFSVTYYAVVKKLSVIAMICEFYGIIIILGILAVQTIVFTRGQLLYLKPLFVYEEMPSYIKASASMLIPFLGMEVLTVIPVNKKNIKKLPLHVISIIAVIGALYIYIVESCFSVRSAEQIIYYKDALIEIVRSVDVKYLEFLRRLDGLFLATWIMTIYTTILVFSNSACFLIGSWFKKANYKIVCLIVMIISLPVSLLPSNDQQVEQIMNYMSYAGVFTALIIPLLMLILTKVKKHGN